MSLRLYLFLFLISLTVLAIATVFLPVPGFMDAEYYFAGGLQLVQGKGFSEPYLWNYLDNPTGLPHPSHAYWMPLAALLAALGMALTGSHQFSAARIGFLLLSALASPLTAALSYRLSKKKDWALLTGFLAIFSGYYLPYGITTDTFPIVMVLGAVFFLSIPVAEQKNASIRWVVLGAISGALHLSRADGILWLLVSLLMVFSSKDDPFLRKAKNIFGVVLGYVLVMGPWMGRNLAAFGTLFSPGGLQALWLTQYDELFSYPASRLTFEHWWASGIGQILEVRFWALGINLQRILAEQGLVFLSPLMILGLWRCRKDSKMAAGLWGWLLTFFGMTFVFPFAGARGGLFHSCVVLQPLFWAMVPVGLNVVMEWGARMRNWDSQRAGRVFSVATVVMAALFSWAIFYRIVIGSDPSQPIWTQHQRKYTQVEETLQNLGAVPDDTVMVKNTPGYYLASNRAGIAIPFGDENTLLAAAKRFGVKYIILESDHPEGLSNLYQDPEKSPADLVYLQSIYGTHIFSLNP